MAHRNVGDGNLTPRLRRSNQAGNFAGKLDPCALTESKTSDVFVKFLVTQRDGQFCSANVTRLHENVFDAKIAKRGVIVERCAAVVPHAVLAKNVGVEAELMFVESSG